MGKTIQKPIKRSQTTYWEAVGPATAEAETTGVDKEAPTRAASWQTGTASHREV